MPEFKKNKSSVLKKKGPFKMKSSPAKIYGKKASAVKNYKKGYYGA
tara:strand:+ start:41 stop:178 length:138 start_codon:yes stop_codon:yes gene_type:complete